jgi:FixJ family two-component response regulator
VGDIQTSVKAMKAGAVDFSQQADRQRQTIRSD